MQREESEAEGGPRVVVVGAGITGLALTHALRKRGIGVRTYEATARPGGVIRSDRVDDRVLEYGPQRLRLSGPLERVVTDLSLEDRLVYAPADAPLYVLANEELREVPRSMRGFLRTDLLSIPGKARALAEPVTSPGRPTETAGDLLARKFGNEAYRNLIEPLLGGIYASDPLSMPAEHALEPVLAMEREERSLLWGALKRLRGASEETPVVSFDEGLQALPRALYEEHRDVVQLGERVKAVADTAYGPYRVKTTDGGVTADVVVLTAPAWSVADILGGHTDSDVEHLQELRYNPLALVHLHADTDAHGLGYQIRRLDDFETRGVTWNAALFDRDGVYTAFLGGAWDPDIVDRDPAEIGETAAREFERVMGTEPAVLEVTVLERAIPAYDYTWSNLARVSLPDGIELATNYTGRIGVSGRLREAERVAERIADGSIHGKRL